MKRLAFAIVVLMATHALAGTERDSMERAIRKYATPPVLDPGKAACVCIDGGPVTHARSGWVRYSVGTIEFRVFCGVAEFNTTTGEQSGQVACLDWIPLTK